MTAFFPCVIMSAILLKENRAWKEKERGKEMKRKVTALLLAVTMTAITLTGCGFFASTKDDTKQLMETEETLSKEEEGTEVRIGSLKGPTSMGLVKLMQDADEGKSANVYSFTIETAADALLPQILQKELDIVLVPANAASVLYNKTEGGVTVIDINTLGVLYMVSGDEALTNISDLKGKTIYLTGKGTTPDYVLHYLLEQNGLREDDVTLEYKSEATEVAAILAKEPESIGLLPQPFVTAACAKNENLKMVFDMTAEWDAVQGEDGSRLVTGVTVVRKEFLQEHPEVVQQFLEEHKASVEFANTNVEETAELVAAQGIVEKAPIAKAAIPYCNITYIDGEEMKSALTGYLSVLMEQNPESIGGKLPGEDFYYTK